MNLRMWPEITTRVEIVQWYLILRPIPVQIGRLDDLETNNSYCKISSILLFFCPDAQTGLN